MPGHDQPEELLAAGIDAATVKATIKLGLADAPDEAVGQTLGLLTSQTRLAAGSHR